MTDTTRGALPGVTVELRPETGPPVVAVTHAQGTYRFARLPPGPYQAAFTLIAFATSRREIDVRPPSSARLDAVLHLLKLDADVTVTGMRTFTNLAGVNGG